MRANIINYSQFAKWNPIFQPQASILALLSPKLKVSCSEYGCQNRVLITLSVCLSVLSHLLWLPFGLLRKPRCGSLLSRHAFRFSRIFSVAFRVLPVFSVSQGFALALPCSFSGSSNEPPSRAFFYQKPLFVENSSFRHPSVRVL